MLIDRVLERNPAIVEAAVRLHQDGAIPPNTWLYDLDAVAHNARIQADAARSLGLTTFVMTKQYSRNPMVTTVALAQGLYKTVAVDVFCAKVMDRYGIPVGHVGHLNQIPQRDVGRVLAMRPDVITVYSVEAARRISEVAATNGVVQDLLVRVYRPGDVFFPGQEGGFRAEELIDAARAIERLPRVRIVGVTSFPCLFYNFDDGREPVHLNPNMETIVDAARRLEQELGLDVTVIDAPGNTSVRTFPMLREAGATHVEPGHGLHGTTPPQIAEPDHPEMPTYVYVSEISHHYEGRAYAFAGGLWTMMARFLDPSWPIGILVGSTPEAAIRNRVDYEHIDQIIDYHVSIPQGDRCRIGDTTVFPMYSQTQMTRSYVAAVSGVSTGEPVVWGIFDHATTMLDDNHDPVPPVDVKARMAELAAHYAPVGVR
ncbi:MAG TPA: alanine racemase [Thermomicrobiales bacterium]